MPVLSDSQKQKCEEKLTISECYSSLKPFQKNKTPGNDGLTAEFYLGFWSIFEKHLVACFNYAHEHGELSNSQKQAVITLLEKKGKDKRLIKNWRPISLINVDTKIASKALAKRLESILPNLIHHNQNAYVKGRSIFDAVRTIDDVIEYTKQANIAGILITIDFEKAFDSLNHQFLFKVLQAFNFGPFFVQWISTFYSKVSSCVMNNGFASNYFAVDRGVRQGDPLSPLLFILSLEILTSSIRQNKHIQGIKIGKKEVKLALFADDMSCFLKDNPSYEHLLSCLEEFTAVSGLKVNKEKTEFFSLGLKKREYFPCNFMTSVKILGVHWSYNCSLKKKENFEGILKSVKKTLNMWKWRGLTLLGKIQIVKSFAIPKFMSKASLIYVSKDLIQAVNKELYNFIWNGKDKVKRLALINGIEHGGLKMLDIECMINTQRIMCLKKYLEDSISSWKFFLDYYLDKVGGKFILKCQFDTSKLPIYLPSFYKDCLDAWAILSKTEVVKNEDIMNQVIWNNKNLLSQGKSIYQPLFHKCGIIKIGDLISKGGFFLKSEKVLKANLSLSHLFILMGIVNAIPSGWRSIIKNNSSTKLIDFNENSFHLPVKGETLDVLSCSSKIVCKEFLSFKAVLPTARAKWGNSTQPCQKINGNKFTL